MHKVWQIREPDETLSQQLASELKVSQIIAQLLVNRGIRDEKTAREFLYPSLSNLHSPERIKGINDAVDRIRHAIARGEKIWIYGDYDVDGITSVSLLLLCLRHLGANVNYYIPRRLDEGYGLNKESLTDLKDKGCNLIITVDCGISSVEEVRIANDAGMDVIITDHHEPSDELPPALVILDPKLEDCGYPFSELAGVGVAFKLAQVLMDDKDKRAFLWDQIDLVALGTLADIVPIIGENRIIARYGLEALNKTERAGIRAICNSSSTKLGSIDSLAVGFRLGPRINAAGRIDTAINAVRLMITDSEDEAVYVAHKLEIANRDRQNIENHITEGIRKQIQQLDPLQEKSLVLVGEGWHPGVIGIAASKLQEEFYRPVILISLDGEIGRGSARSIPGLDMFHALKKCSHLLEKFGGHKAAAGLSIAKENIEKFRREFSQIVTDMLSHEDLLPKVDIDVEASLSNITEEVVEQLSLLEPYGIGNPQPLFALSNLSMKGLPRPVGKNSEHLQITVSDGQTSMRSIAFNMAKLERELDDKNIKIDLACRPYINVWHDTKAVELNIKEVMIHRQDRPEVVVASDEILELPQFKIVDRRNIPDKKRYIQKLLLKGEKTLMYVRDDSAVNQLQSILSLRVSGAKLGLCYLTTPEVERDRIKSALIQNQLSAIVSSVPFEEPLPGLTHMVFCHPVPTQDDFINFCAPAIEASEPVYIHLIFNNNDIELLTDLLNHQYPDRNMLANIYRKIKELYNYSNSPIPIEEIFAGMDIAEAKELIISNGITIFEEINLVQRQYEDGKITVSILAESQRRRDLHGSQFYSNGDKIKNEWVKFSDFLLKKTAEDIHKMLLEAI